MRTIGLQHHRLLDAVIHRVDGAGCMRFQSDCVDAFLGTFSFGQMVEALDNAFLLEVDGGGPSSLSHRKPLWQSIDGDDLLCAEQHRASDRHLTDWAAAPDRDSIVWLDIALS